MLSESVAQNPTIPVKPGKKKLQNSAVVLNFDGWDKMGPSPFPAEIAQNKSANAAMGRTNALNTKSFRMLSTPRYTTNIFNNQKRKNVMAGAVCKPNDAGKICGSNSMDGIQIFSIRYNAYPPIQV